MTSVQRASGHSTIHSDRPHLRHLTVRPQRAHGVHTSVTLQSVPPHSKSRPTELTRRPVHKASTTVQSSFHFHFRDRHTAAPSDRTGSLRTGTRAGRGPRTKSGNGPWGSTVAGMLTREPTGLIWLHMSTVADKSADKLHCFAATAQQSGKTFRSETRPFRPFE